MKRLFNKGFLIELFTEFKWMFPYVKKYWASICFYILAGVFGIGMSLASSLVSKNLVDTVLGNGSGSVSVLAALMVGLALGNIITNALINRISARINVIVQNELQAEIFEKVINSDWESLNEFRSGDLLNRLNSDAAQVATSVITWIPGFITKLVQFGGALCIILYYDPIMAVIALLGAPVTILMSRFLMKRMHSYNKEIREISSDIMSFQNDSFRNLQTVKAFGLMDTFNENLKQIQSHYKNKMLDYNRFSIYTSSILSVVGLMVSYSCFGWSIYRLWTGYITVGTMMMFIQMANSLSSSFRALVQMAPSAINAATCAGRLMAVADLEKERFMENIDVAQMQGQLSVCLNDVSIGYKEGNQVLENGNFLAKSGEIVTIIGPSGEGKTSLIRILLGLIYPKTGTAKIITDSGYECGISAASRHLFGYVPQGNTVFTGTIAENMRMVKADATDEEIVEALKLACAYDFVSELPEGIYSSIKEQGAGFSEGQAQRISIARALIKDAPILLLDEATSALDVEIEAMVLDNIMSCGKKKVCIVTTHRPGVLSRSNHIYEIKDNKLVKVK